MNPGDEGPPTIYLRPRKKGRDTINLAGDIRPQLPEYPILPLQLLGPVRSAPPVPTRVDKKRPWWAFWRSK
jgi:hypothetical protein